MRAFRRARLLCGITDRSSYSLARDGAYGKEHTWDRGKLVLCLPLFLVLLSEYARLSFRRFSQKLLNEVVWRSLTALCGTHAEEVFWVTVHSTIFLFWSLFFRSSYSLLFDQVGLRSLLLQPCPLAGANDYLMFNIEAFDSLVQTPRNDLFA